MSIKEKMKVYHGLPKSPIDEHTIFYASFDGTLTPEIGSPVKCNYVSNNFSSSVTGYGVYSPLYNSGKVLDLSLTQNLGDTFTLDAFVDTSKVSDFTDTNHIGCYLMTSNFKSIIRWVSFKNNKNTLAFRFYDESGTYLPAEDRDITISTGIHHIRLVGINGKISVYIDSKFIFTTTNTVPYNLARVHRIHQMQGIVSDLHISNTDRGNYFPNLPQDFIEGKAIIKERLGQQQIKGDPLISQTTELIVDSSSKLPKPYSNEVNADDTYTHLYKPELSVLNANLWNNTSKLKIKGLNGEIISGVIDSDTAFCRVLEYQHILRVKVDDVSKISVGDTFYVYYPDTNEVDSLGVRVVESIDTTNKTVTCSSNYGYNINITKGVAYLIETTVSSSSPIVKTTDGTTVVGTWTGLGTSEATFTLGTNTGLTEKDLVVTYSLNMPQGNSHFPELPSDIERAYTETGIEMKPVNEILITDDFIGKVSGDTKNCPHTLKFHNAPTLIEPTGGWAGELKTNEYSIIASVDNSTIPVLNQLSGHIPQLLISFNLIEIVERKIGEIPGDKVQWLKDNVEKLTLLHHGYGVCPSGNKIQFSIGANYFSSFSWQGGSTFHTNSTPTLTKYPTLDNYAYNKISRDGYVNWLATTDASDGSAPSAIYTDYVGIEVLLVKDTTFTTLYCDNKRARKDKCNPVLIQKETKTVRRYLPSKECFVTESLVYKPMYSQANGNSIIPNCKGLVKDNFIGITNYGTANPRLTAIGSGDSLTPIIPKLPLNNLYKSYQFDRNIPVPHKYSNHFPDNVGSYSPYLKFPVIADNVGYYSEPHAFAIGGQAYCTAESLDAPYIWGVRFFKSLVQSNNEIYLKIQTVVPNTANYENTVTTVLGGNYNAQALYRLPNRPLIK